VPEHSHRQIPISVTVDVDEGIAWLVMYLNTMPGIRTLASCQGTIGEGGPKPYRPQVMVTWAHEAAFKRLQIEFDLSQVSRRGSWCYVHPRQTK
jgi:hypothetical protein